MKDNPKPLKDALMKEQENKADWRRSTNKSKPKQNSAHEADPHHDAVKHKHDEPLGRVGIAPPKPVWPSKK